jgi:Flp pilus assembly protein TadB
MDPITSARREAGLEIEALAQEFERSDESAFRGGRIICWITTAVVGVVALIFLIVGADWRYIASFAVAIIGLVWLAYWFSARRQRQQTAKLRALATRWLTAGSPR